MSRILNTPHVIMHVPVFVLRIPYRREVWCGEGGGRERQREREREREKLWEGIDHIYTHFRQVVYPDR